MYEWLSQDYREAGARPGFGPLRATMHHHRANADRLMQLELRDRWGYMLEHVKLMEISAFVERHFDHDLASQDLVAALAETEERLAIQISLGNHEFPQFCDGHDEIAGDETIATVVRTVLNINEGDMPNVG